MSDVASYPYLGKRRHLKEVLKSNDHLILIYYDMYSCTFLPEKNF